MPRFKPFELLQKVRAWGRFGNRWRQTNVLLVAMVVVASAVGVVGAEDSSALRAEFASPSRHYSSGPLWVWNDLLTDQQIVNTLHDLASQQVKQVWVHPRPGLMTPYLSEDWFHLWHTALKEAEKLDMNVWIYDENSYPSGFAGGLVPEALPDSRGQGIRMQELKSEQIPRDNVLAIFQKQDGTFARVDDRRGTGEPLPKGKYLAAVMTQAPSGGWFGGKWYVDLLKPGVTEKFIDITFNAYRREIGDQFGKRVPGIFTDEPHLCPAGGLHFNEHVAAEFQQRWGYDLVDHLPSLVQPVGDWRRVRHNYQQLLLEQFIEHWSMPCYQFCEDNDLEFTGHYWEHGWPGASHGPDNMAMYAWHQRPAIDNLMNEYRTDTHAQFGNSRTVKELSSVANQLGRTRTLCETYGAGGWDLRFEDMKRIGDWLYVLGVNTLNEHLSYVTIRGARKRDHPQSFSYHTPWWDSYHVMAKYFTRLSLALSSGKQVNHLLVLEPTTTGWMYQSDGAHAANLAQMGAEFVGVVNQLEAAQVEYDLGSEDIIRRHGSIEGKNLVVGQRSYHTVVLPPRTENLNNPTIELLEQMVANGGQVICCGEPPAFVDGRPSDRAEILSQQATWRRLNASQLPATLLALETDGFAIHRAENDKGILFHHRRQFDDGNLLFLVNTSITDASKGTVVTASKGIEVWDLERGTQAAYPAVQADGGVSCHFDLPPCGSLLLFLSKEASDAVAKQVVERKVIQPEASPKIKRLEPNVLTLDYVDITVGDVSRQNMYFYQASQLAFRENGMERNPWDSAVQFRDELITRTFPADSGVEVNYRFEIEGKVPQPLHIVIERPDLYHITCNGKAVKASEGDWWLDRAFGKVDIGDAAQLGVNVVTLTASPFSVWHEIEPAYVLGDFSLAECDSGFVIQPPRPLSLGDGRGHSADPDGTMWLTGGIGWEGDTGTGDANPWVMFDLGKPVDLRRIDIWNYNEVNLTARGAKKIRISGSTTRQAGRLPIDLGTIELDQALSGSTRPMRAPEFPARVDVQADGVRFVRFDILSNHRGVTYPPQKEVPDNAFVGLSEVRFLESRAELDQPREVSDVTIAAVSSELKKNFNRVASHLVDGTGLTNEGWNGQGCPFYASGVSYTEVFHIDRKSSQYLVSLPDWYGSVAEVLVNGQLVGHVAHAPWECDVTEAISSGENRIEVVVIGTLRNTLGPHHQGAMLGRAWPSAFHHGPNPGPPPGGQYNTVAYGLFQPFVLVEASQRELP